MDTYKHGARCWSHWSRERERVTGPYTWPNGNMNLDKTSGWLSTFQFAPGLIVYCECEWVYLALMQLVISVSSWLPSVIRDQDGIKRNNKHDPFRNNLLRLFFLLSARSQWDVNIGIMRGDKWEAAMVSDGGDPDQMPSVVSAGVRIFPGNFPAAHNRLTQGSDKGVTVTRHGPHLLSTHQGSKLNFQENLAVRSVESPQ